MNLNNHLWLLDTILDSAKFEHTKGQTAKEHTLGSIYTKQLFSHFWSQDLKNQFALQRVVYEGYMRCLVVQLCLSLGDPTDCSPQDSSDHGDAPWSGLLCPPPGDLPHPGMKSHNSGLPHCRWIFFNYLSHQGRPRILE